MKAKLIIFDNDGVLIDSEIIWHQFCSTEMTRLGFHMTVEQSILLFSGVNHDVTPEELIAREYGPSNIMLDFDKIGRETEASYSSQLKSIEGIQRVLEFLNKEKIAKCIASNGDFDYVKTTLEITGLKKYFDDEAIFGVEEKLKRKPEPDVFLHAAKKYAIDPKDCLVIEDHALGIMAAKNAKMITVGFLGASHAKSKAHQKWIQDSRPHFLVKDSRQLLDLITRLI